MARRAVPSSRQQSQPEARRERWRALTDAEQVAIRTAAPTQTDVALAWRFGVSVAEIARIRASQASPSLSPASGSGRHSA